MQEASQYGNQDSAFYELIERFRAAEDPAEIKKLGDDLGRRLFGNEEDPLKPR